MEEYIGKICPFCKTEIKEGDNVIVCPECGIPHHEACWEENRGCTTLGCPQRHSEGQHTYLADFCVKCGAPLSEGQDFCPKCGTPKSGEKKRVCSKCGAILQEGENFCPKCGQKADLQTDAGVNAAISQFNQVVTKTNDTAKKKPVKIAIIATVAILAIVLASVFVPKISKSADTDMRLSENGSNSKIYSLEGDWEFVSILFDGSEITPAQLKNNDWDLPILKCTESEFTVDALGVVFSGGWESIGDLQYRLFEDNLDEFTAILETERNNKQTLTLKDTDTIQKLTGHTMTLVFERNSSNASLQATNSQKTNKESSFDMKNLEGNWQFVSMIFDETEITLDLLKDYDMEIPTLNCTKSKYTIEVFDVVFSGTWENIEDKQFRFFDGDLNQFTGTVKIEGSDKQTLELKESYETRKLTGHTMTMVFIRK